MTWPAKLILGEQLQNKSKINRTEIFYLVGINAGVLEIKQIKRKFTEK